MSQPIEYVDLNTAKLTALFEREGSVCVRLEESAREGMRGSHQHMGVCIFHEGCGIRTANMDDPS